MLAAQIDRARSHPAPPAHMNLRAAARRFIGFAIPHRRPRRNEL
jgi:hypothetical protein